MRIVAVVLLMFSLSGCGSYLVKNYPEPLDDKKDAAYLSCSTGSYVTVLNGVTVSISSAKGNWYNCLARLNPGLVVANARMNITKNNYRYFTEPHDFKFHAQPSHVYKFIAKTDKGLALYELFGAERRMELIMYHNVLANSEPQVATIPPFKSKNGIETDNFPVSKPLKKQMRIYDGKLTQYTQGTSKKLDGKTINTVFTNKTATGLYLGGQYAVIRYFGGDGKILSITSGPASNDHYYILKNTGTWRVKKDKLCVHFEDQIEKCRYIKESNSVYQEEFVEPDSVDIDDYEYTYVEFKNDNEFVDPQFAR